MANTDQVIETNQFENSSDNKNCGASEIITFISKIDKVEELLNKNCFSIPKDQLEELLKILLTLSTETKNVVPLNNIINCINDIFEDGKLEVHEIPLLIKVLHDNALNKNITDISSADFSLLLKLLIIILVELNIIKLNSNDIKIINALIDTSLELLNIQIHIPSKENLTKCCLCKLFC